MIPPYNPDLAPCIPTMNNASTSSPALLRWGVAPMRVPSIAAASSQVCSRMGDNVVNSFLQYTYTKFLFGDKSGFHFCTTIRAEFSFIFVLCTVGSFTTCSTSRRFYRVCLIPIAYFMCHNYFSFTSTPVHKNPKLKTH